MRSLRGSQGGETLSLKRRADPDQKRITVICDPIRDRILDKLGLVAQLVERRLCKAEALGPNPSKSIQLMCTTQG